MKKVHAALALTLLILAPLAVAETPADVPDAPPAPADAAPLLFDQEPNMTPLPEVTPEPLEMAKNCNLQDKVIYWCVSCELHCNQWENCGMNACILTYPPNTYWCDCQEIAF
jgi:hypothetical protein